MCSGEWKGLPKNTDTDAKWKKGVQVGCLHFEPVDLRAALSGLLLISLSLQHEIWGAPYFYYQKRFQMGQECWDWGPGNCGTRKIIKPISLLTLIPFPDEALVAWHQ